MPAKHPKEAQVVRFTNVFDFDYTHAYGGIPYQLRAGETILLPWVIGDHLATHLARQAIIRKAPVRDENDSDGRGGETKRSDRPLWDDEAIKALKEKIIKDAYIEEREAPVSEEEQYKRKFEELNKQYPSMAGNSAPSTPTSSTGSANIMPADTTANDVNTPYADKSEVLAELTKRGIPHNPRLARAKLEELLKALK